VQEDQWLTWAARLSDEVYRLDRRYRGRLNLVAAMIVGLVCILLPLTLQFWAGRPTTQPEPEAEMATTVKALQQDSAKATALLQRLQSELQERTRTAQQIEAELKELQKQRKLLDLTPEQKEALQGLVRMTTTVSEIFTSLDFWLGRVLPSAFFFLLGTFFTLFFRRRRQITLTPPPSSNHQLVPGDSAREKPLQRT